MGWLSKTLAKNTPVTSLSAKKDAANRRKEIRKDLLDMAAAKRREAAKVMREIDRKTKAGDHKGLAKLYDRHEELNSLADLSEKSAKRYR
jgi:hypothetical protein